MVIILSVLCIIKSSYPVHTNSLLLKNVFLRTTDGDGKRWLQSGWTKIERWEAAEAEREEDEGRDSGWSD